MRPGLAAIASGLLVSACSVVGVRSVEEPAYQTLAQIGGVEIRSYAPRLAAETLVAGDELAARSTGFRLLAAYIFGANQGRTAIAMTAPVAQSAGSETIAMTAPVDQAPAPAGQWRIRFFMPAHYTRETLPGPNDPRVQIVTVPAQSVAVLRYSGIPSARAAREAAAKLLSTLDGSAWHPHGAPMAWFYDPPWTLPPFRRNEAAVAVDR